MIALETLAGVMDQLTGDATKVAIMLMTVQSSSLRADAQWVTDCGAAAGLHTSVVRAGLQELVSLGLIEKSGKIFLTGTSQVGYMGQGGRGESTSSNSVTENQQVLAGISSNSQNGFQPPVRPSVSPTAENQRRPGTSISSITSPDPKAALSWRELLAGLDEICQEATGGKLLLDGKERALLKQLVDKAGTDEVYRRAEIMWKGPPLRWPAPPYDLGTLRFHWTKFSKKHTPPRRVTNMIDDETKQGSSYYGEG